MPYDPGLDNCVFNRTWENETERLSVRVFSYNNGPKKMQINREQRDREGNFRYVKLGRMTKEEVAAILPLMQEALNSMD